MFMLGAKKDGVERPHHTPVFDIDDRPCRLVLADVVFRRLLRQKASQ